MDILGVRVDNLERNEILEKIEIFLNEERFHQIATINPEFVLEAHENSDFKKVLNMCDLNVADGIGIRFAFWRFGQKLKCRFTGVDLTYEILRLAQEKKLSVFLLIKKGGLSSFEEIKKALLQKYPDLDMRGIDIDLGKSILDLNLEPRDVLFCNFGAPDQEFFINLTKNDRIRLAMGVGGTFDFVTGKAKRAPVWMQKIGLEWLWRFVQQPKRIARILRATIIFPIKIIFTRNV